MIHELGTLIAVQWLSNEDAENGLRVFDWLRWEKEVHQKGEALHICWLCSAIQPLNCFSTYSMPSFLFGVNLYISILFWMSVLRISKVRFMDRLMSCANQLCQGHCQIKQEFNVS